MIMVSIASQAHTNTQRNGTPQLNDFSSLISTNYRVSNSASALETTTAHVETDGNNGIIRHPKEREKCSDSNRTIFLKMICASEFEASKQVSK